MIEKPKPKRKLHPKLAENAAKLKRGEPLNNAKKKTMGMKLSNPTKE